MGLRKRRSLQRVKWLKSEILLKTVIGLKVTFEETSGLILKDLWTWAVIEGFGIEEVFRSMVKEHVLTPEPEKAQRERSRVRNL
jgi:hypothetical protein